MRIAVPGKKALKPDHIRRPVGSDQDGAGGSAPKQGDPTKNERAHDPFAEFGFGDEQRPQAARWDH